MNVNFENILTEKEKQRIVYTMRLLLSDKKISANRLAAADYVSGFLRAKLDKKLSDIGLNDSFIDDFVKTGAGESQFIDLIITNRLLPDNELQKFKKLLKPDRSKKISNETCRKSAVDAFYSHMLWKEGINFRKSAKINNKVWDKFIYGISHTSEATINAIIEGLKLDKNGEEAEKLRNLCIKQSLKVTSDLKSAVHDYTDSITTKNRQTVTDFLTYSGVTAKEWEKFSGPPDSKHTSQNTILKLSTGFGHSLSQAEDFLSVAHSRFAMKSDLVFLSAILCDMNNPDAIRLIFSEIFTNCTSPYKK